jgi:hypothetical protein
MSEIVRTRDSGRGAFANSPEVIGLSKVTPVENVVTRQNASTIADIPTSEPIIQRDPIMERGSFAVEKTNDVQELTEDSVNNVFEKSFTNNTMINIGIGVGVLLVVGSIIYLKFDK